MIRRLRLGSGLVMLAYVAMHLINHAAGLVSLATMAAMLRWVLLIWSNPPMQALLYGSFAVHYVLALQALWQRRSLRLRFGEATQLVLGFAIPILLARHVVGTRVAHDFFGTDYSFYPYILWFYFIRRPDLGYLQLLVLVIAWAHAMLGLHFWLRVRPWYERVAAPALVLAVLVPVLAVLGAAEGARQVIALAAMPGWLDGMFMRMTLPSPEAVAALNRITNALTWGFALAVAAVLLARVVRRDWRRRRGLVRIAYPDGRAIEVVAGTSILEASRLARIPHASVCGGRGRCSTCRVRVRAELHALAPPEEAEARVLRRIRATPNVRLACQLRPHGAVEVTPLLPPFAVAADGRRHVDLAQGGEREIAILFADIRGFTSLAEGRLPYDVVFILNRYFAAMGRAVEAAGGRVDKFIGDGVMALFGIEDGAGAAGCAAALAAARLMAVRLDELNHSLHAELDAPLRIGIGIHAGPVIVGEMGYGGAATITAIGDAVNTASRLEGLTKEYRCQLVVSEEAVGRAGLDLSAFPRHEIEVRGRREMLAIRTIENALDLPHSAGRPPADRATAPPQEPAPLPGAPA
jgi:adenylate cyclase